jgi:uncharacterized membrane protein YkoI
MRLKLSRDSVSDQRESSRVPVPSSISVINLVVLSAQDAVLEALGMYPGATVHSIELEEESGRPQWQVELTTASGEREVSIWAD